MNIKERIDNYFCKSGKEDLDEIASLFLSDENEDELEDSAWKHWNASSGDKVSLEHILENIHETVIRKPIVIPARKRWLYRYYRIAGCLLIPLFLLLGYTLLFTGRVSDRGKQNVEMATQAGQRCSFVLSDGTKVWLNSDSKLQYPQTFTGENRRVILSGEGYFEVAHNEDSPFIVETLKLAVKAVGTSFNVRAYSDAKNVEVTLLSGKVLVKELNEEKSNQTLTLNPGQRFSLDLITNKKSVTWVNADRFKSWTNGILSFRDDPLSMVVERLSRRYNVNMVIADEDLKNIKYTATYTVESIDQILAMMQKVLPIVISDSMKVLKKNGNGMQSIKIKRKGGVNRNY